MKREYIITIYSENHIGLLTRITIVFTRRKINIDSLTVSESAIPGVYKFTIVVQENEAQVKKVVGQLEKQIDVLKAFFHTNEEMVYQEIALYKVPIEPIYESDEIEKIIRLAGARTEMTVTQAVAAARDAGRNYITIASEFLGQDA